MIISFALCAIASLETVTLSAHERDKVPKNDEFSLSDAGFVHANDLVVYITASDDAFVGSAVLMKASGPAKAFKIGEMESYAADMIIPRFDPGEFASRDYKSPHVDRSWIWRYQHFHNC